MNGGVTKRLARALTSSALTLGLAWSALASAMATPTTSAVDASSLVVKGRVLTVDGGYLAFTTGDAVQLGDVEVPKGLRLGQTVLVRIDVLSHLVTAIVVNAVGTAPAEIDASALPRDIIAVDPRSARASVAAAGSNGNGGAGSVVVTIDVAVPDVTPPDDDVYLSTDRTNFASAELRMNRVDARDWTISLPLASGGTLRYVFTRGSPSTVERQQNGTIVTPRELSATAAAHAKDHVARWADRY